MHPIALSNSSDGCANEVDDTIDVELIGVAPGVSHSIGGNECVVAGVGPSALGVVGVGGVPGVCWRA